MNVIASQPQASPGALTEEVLVLRAVHRAVSELRRGTPVLVHGAEGALLVRNPSARLAWSELDDGVVLFASGLSRRLDGELRELLKLICSADIFYLDNLAPWLDNDEALTLIHELVKQGSLEFANDE